MEQLQVLKKLTTRLESIAIPYFITGSFASSYYGIPRRKKAS
ncbi:MAG: hypothetical protein RDV48_29565 [Candidatus Eremiobacteraeota bacterium]|nr:hypothetical protein [Candidatus Eremiobacteraeota bacterium]